MSLTAETLLISNASRDKFTLQKATVSDNNDFFFLGTFHQATDSTHFHVDQHHTHN